MFKHLVKEISGYECFMQYIPLDLNHIKGDILISFGTVPS